MTAPKRYDWRSDGKPYGHQSYCVAPFHSAVTTYCSADPSEPATMQGLPSAAWHADHPVE